MLDVYPIITYNYFVYFLLSDLSNLRYTHTFALLVTTAIKTQVITGLAPEKASTGLTCGNRRLVRLNAWVLILGLLVVVT